MAASVEGYHLHEVMFELYKNLTSYGAKVSPREQETRELLGQTLLIQNPALSLLTKDIRPGYNPAIAAAEAAQLIGGVSDPALMVRISQKFAQFRNAGIFMGAYGPRIRTQLPQVVARLKSDASSRQAFVGIWRPQDDLWSSGVVDVPCTIGFQFFLRNNRLFMHTSMRSNDAWLGLPYDVFQFTQLQLTLCNALDVEDGHYMHTAGSMHLYERDLHLASQLANPYGGVYTSVDEADQPRGFDCDDQDISNGMTAAAATITGETGRNEWYDNTLARYFGGA